MGYTHGTKTLDWPNSFNRYYRDKRGDAKKRGIDFHFTKAELWALWQPYWHLRVKGKCGYNGYALSRYGDTGPYTVENCRIITHEQNSSESWTNVIRKRLTF